MKTTMHDVSSIVISKTDMETFGTVEVEVTTTDGEKLRVEKTSKTQKHCQFLKALETVLLLRLF